MASISDVTTIAPSRNLMSTVGRSFIKLGPVMSVPFRHLPLKGAAESKTTRSFFLVRLFL